MSQLLQQQELYRLRQDTLEEWKGRGDWILPIGTNKAIEGNFECCLRRGICQLHDILIH